MDTPAQALLQLKQVRDIVLSDAKVYPQVVPGVLGVIGSNSHIALRRWGADFLAETFASPVLNAEEKQKLCLGTLDTLRGYLNRKEIVGEDEDPTVVQSAVQCAASIYPLVFRYTVVNPADSTTWSKMAGIKSSILRRMDTAPAGVRICCIKFVARVVQVQTPGVIADPRRPESNEISLALVPREHPVIPPSNLEAEASGLLDRLLGVLQDNLTDALVVTATLNSLSTLVQRRASVSTKILMTLLNFNPLKLASGHVSGKDKIAVRSMTRTIMSFLVNVLKRNPNHNLAARLQQRTEQLRHGLIDAFAETGPGKRKEPDEPTDGLDDAKRRRIDADASNGVISHQQGQQAQEPVYPPLPPGPVTVAQLFTLSRDPSAAGFHVELIPPHTVAQLIPPLLRSIDQQKLEIALTAVRARFLQLDQRPPASAIEVARAVAGDDEDDDYDPTIAFPGHDQVMNQLDQLPPEGVGQDVATRTFALPPAPPLTEQQKDEYSKMALTRVFGTLTELDREARAKAANGKKLGSGEKGFNKLAVGGGAHDREGWITLITRLATRTPFGLLDEGTAKEDGEVKEENFDRAMVKKNGGNGAPFDLATGIRQALLNYVLEDFRRRIDVAVAWLNEEWYADRMLSLHKPSSNPDPELPNYMTYSVAVLDALAPFLDTKDGRTLTRYLSELPLLTREHLERVARLAEDPERVTLACNGLLYLILLRPPIRAMCLDILEDMWKNNSEAKAAAAKILGKWRPGVLEEGRMEVGKEDGDGSG